ncbi:MAG: hypothetical protein ACQEVA_09830 [Myxococcota bacterium]
MPKLQAVQDEEMIGTKTRWKAVLGSLFALAALSLLLTACGGETCEDKDCAFGVCEEGACVNPDSCEDASDCLPGYGCESDRCRALQACEEDDDCPVGVCGNDAVCTNPSSCTENADCLDNSYCADSGRCEPDPCNEVECEMGGVCERGTTNCVSADTCTDETEASDCVDGERCLDGTCQTEDELCESLDCQRGVCSFTEKACVSVDDCQGDDTLCADGQICSEDDECIDDFCVQNDVECGDNGVCLPRVGECENAETCESNADCLADHLCLEGTCRLESAACGDGGGDGGCFGNQTCVYNAGEMTVSCVEPATCETSLDCTGETQCGGEDCLEPVACRNDRFESNDTEAEAVSLMDAGLNQSLQAELCQGDVDVFTFDTQEFEPFVIRGTLMLKADYADRDAGLGEIQIELLRQQPDDTFASVETASSGPRGRDGAAVIERTFSAADQGVYMVKVTSAEELSSAGVSYTLSAHLLNDRAVTACEDAVEITSSQTLSGDLSAATSTQFGSSCTATENDNPEQAYYFDLQTPARVDVIVTPDTEEEDIAVSLRGECGASHTELGCSNAGDEGSEMIQGRLLDPGTYYILVEAAPESSVSTYDINLSVTNASCSPASSYCEDDTVSNFCSDGSTTQTATCGQGCDPTTGRCFRVDGDRCQTASEIVPGTTETIEWNQYFDDYSVPSGGCVPGGLSTETGGPDKAFRVTVPEAKSLRATLTMASGEPGSVYLVDSCQSAEGTCRAGANGGGDNETFTWVNDTGAEQTLFLIADSAGGGATLTSAELDIEFLDVICEPDNLSCDSNDNVQRCDAFGVSYIPENTCSYGCTDGECDAPPGDACNTAKSVSVSPGSPVTETGSFGDFANELTLPIGECRIDLPHQSTTEMAGPDAFYEVDLNAGELLTASLTTNASDPGMYVLTGCGGGSPAENCQWADLASTELKYFAPTTGTYTLVVDTESATSSSFTLDLSVEAAGTYVCQPDGTNCSGTNPSELNVCNTDGTVIENTYTCQDGCRGGFCSPASTPNDTCSSATQVTGGAIVFDSPTRFSDDLDIGGAGCGSTDDGLEAVYRVDLSADEVLTVEYQGAGPGSTVNHDPSIYLLRDGCSNLSQNCVGADDGDVESDDPAFVRYSASTDETIYVVAETDTTSTSHTDERWYLNIDVQPTECTPGSSQCNSSGTALQICEDYGLYTEYPCNGGCSGGACADPRGDICADAIPVTPGVTAPGDFSTQSNQLETGTDTCLQGAVQDGPETFYEIEVSQSDVILEAKLNNATGSNASMYVLDSCTSDASSCLFGQANTTELQTYISQPGLYYLVVDSPSSQSWTYDLDVTISPGGVCQPGGVTCKSDGSLDVCSEDGLSIEYSAACSIDCSGQSCGTPTTANDTCSGAFTISGSTRLIDEYARFNDDLNPQNTCGISDAPGPDAVYELALGADENVRATVQAVNSSDDPAIYIVANCDFPSATCYAGQQSNSPTASTGYYSALGETVYLVVDSDNASDTDSFILDVEVNTAECVTGDARCTTSGDAEICSISRTWETEECYFGCSNATCEPPPNDTCATATVVPTDGTTHVYEGPMDAYNDDYDIDGASCMPSSVDNSPGPDAVYSVDAQANDIINITWTPPDEASLYIVTDCADIKATCVAGNESFTSPTSIEYVAPADDTYYIVADVDATSSTNVSDLFEMEIRVAEPNCIFGQTSPTCLSDGQTVEYCATNNTLTEFACDGTCTNGECDNRTGDTCIDAKDATAGASQTGGITYTFDTTQLGEFHDSTSTHCGVTTAYTDGLDAFARVDLQAGETLTATLVPAAAPSVVYADPGLLIVSSCLEGASTCLAGESGQDQTVTTSYTATADETVYVIADSDEDAPTSNQETFDLTLEVQ